jgi:guanylate kinase
MRKGKLFVISGASGVGKSTVLAKVMETNQNLQFSVSATTRPPRKGEVEAVSYYFVSKQQFEEMIRQDAFLEYDAHMDNYYGTPKAQLEEKLLAGDVILDIDPNGAFNVRKTWPEAVLIFIAPPSVEELERRLRSRGDTDEDQIRVRLDRVQWEMEQGQKYDHMVINDRVDACADEILNIITNQE